MELYAPRWLEFTATENLRDLGQHVRTEEQTVHRVRMLRGIMMGDPLTKVILHLQNVSVRLISENCTEVEFWKG